MYFLGLGRQSAIETEIANTPARGEAGMKQIATPRNHIMKGTDQRIAYKEGKTKAQTVTAGIGISIETGIEMTIDMTRARRTGVTGTETEIVIEIASATRIGIGTKTDTESETVIVAIEIHEHCPTMIILLFPRRRENAAPLLEALNHVFSVTSQILSSITT
jgi:hypothetical protein